MNAHSPRSMLDQLGHVRRAAILEAVDIGGLTQRAGQPGWEPGYATHDGRCLFNDVTILALAGIGVFQIDGDNVARPTRKAFEIAEAIQFQRTHGCFA